MRGEHQTALENFRHDFRGTGLLELVDVAVILGAHDHRQVWAQQMGEFQDFHGRMRIGIGDDECPGTHQARSHQYFTLRGIAIDDGFASRRGFADLFRVKIQRKERDVFLGQ